MHKRFWQASGKPGKGYEHRFSLTDYTLIAHARAVGARVATFDAALDGPVDGVW